MKITRFLILLACCGAVHAQEAGKPDRQQLVGAALDDYAKVAGGWFINQRCKFISGTDLKSYETDFATITVAMGQVTGNPRMLLGLQSDAMKLADSPKYAGCADLQRQIVAVTSGHVHDWAAEIRRIQGGK